MAPVAPFGYSELTIDNGTEKDAAVKLRDIHGTDVRFFYVAAGTTAKIADIAPGQYDVLVTAGIDWSGLELKFLRKADYWKFEEPLIFVDDGEYVTTWTLTLHPVAGGTAEAEDVSEAEFDN